MLFGDADPLEFWWLASECASDADVKSLLPELGRRREELIRAAALDSSLETAVLHVYRACTQNPALRDRRGALVMRAVQEALETCRG